MSQFDADYFLRGKETGKSLYENYRWMPELTIPMVRSIIEHLGIDSNDTILDFGCARGYVVRAFQEMGYNAYGYDTSKWAIENADQKIFHHLTRLHKIAFRQPYDWVIAKDVLEHVDSLCGVIDCLMDNAYKGVFAVVPLSHDGKQYDVPEYERDITHIHRRPLQWWVGHFHRPGWSVEGRYRLPGVKDNYSQYPTGNGFVTCRRLSV